MHNNGIYYYIINSGIMDMNRYYNLEMRWEKLILANRNFQYHSKKPDKYFKCLLYIRQEKAKALGYKGSNLTVSPFDRTNKNIQQDESINREV